MLQEKNAFVSLFSWLYANFIVTNSGNAGHTGAWIETQFCRPVALYWMGRPPYGGVD